MSTTTLSILTPGKYNSSDVVARQAPLKEDDQVDNTLLQLVENRVAEAGLMRVKERRCDKVPANKIDTNLFKKTNQELDDAPLVLHTHYQT